MTRLWVLACALTTALAASPSIADDWVAVKLRGRVLQLVGNEWQQLKRGDVVSDDRVVRTLGDGKVSFQRAAETIDLGANTQIQIHDRNGKRFTTVQQYFGEVGIQAELRQVQHFAVQTPQLVAVVKGTQFIVTSDGKTAEVRVKRGHVAVEDRDTHQTTTVAARQSASTSDGNAPLIVSGLGKLPPVYAANGKPVVASDGKGLASPKEAAKAAYAAALDAGLSKKEAQKAAKEAEKEAKDASKAAEKAAGSSAYAEAIASGASPKEAEKAAKSAEKQAKEESKTSEKAAKEEAKAAEQQSKSEEKASKHESKSDAGSGSSSESSGKGHGGGGDSGGGGGKGHGKDK